VANDGLTGVGQANELISLGCNEGLLLFCRPLNGRDFACGTDDESRAALLIRDGLAQVFRTLNVGDGRLGVKHEGRFHETDHVKGFSRLLFGDRRLSNLPQRLLPHLIR